MIGINGLGINQAGQRTQFIVFLQFGKAERIADDEVKRVCSDGAA